ncbi:transcription antitermination factor NusB [Candidatus Phytoplasma palmae]|uniref:transcription antitermination factor NusB n=1 Tax=Candidatus Phytoplasma palmae TaxID=85624 RepID=UPI003990BC1E
MLPSKIKKLRIKIIQSLYQYDFYHNEIPDYHTIYEDKTVFKYIIDNIVLIDKIIQKNLYNYDINRLNKVDKAIIRLATLELLEKKISHKIIINEAIKITKEYSSLMDNKQYKFNNKILHLIYEDIQCAK